MSGGGGSEGDGGFADADLARKVGNGAGGVGRRDDDAEGEEREVEDRNVERVGGENEGAIAMGEAELGLEREG